MQGDSSLNGCGVQVKKIQRVNYPSFRYAQEEASRGIAKFIRFLVHRKPQRT